MEDQLRQRRFIGGCVVRQQTLFNTALANAREIKAGTIIADADGDFITGLRQRQRDLADSRLAGHAAGHGIFNAVRGAVAQQVFDRPGHFFQHRAVDPGLPVVNIQIDTLAGILCRLPDHAMQAFGKAVERYQARAHQVL